MNKILQELEQPTKSDSTKEKYLNRGRQLYSLAVKELNEINPDPRQFVAWLIEKKPAISRSSWRQYKNSVIYYLEQNNAEQAPEAIQYLQEINSKGCILKSEKTSSNKLKKIPVDDWERINSYLERNYGKWHKELQLWLKSSYITGLRPVEWQYSKLITYDGDQALLVKNAKNTNGRAHGEERTIILKGLIEEEWKIIKQHLHNVYNFKAMGDYDFFYRGCAHTLYRVCRDIWPRRKKHVTLYSTRHQFSANAKASGLSKPQIAALMGHAVDDTATIHYGRKTAGREETVVEPIEIEVGRIRISEKSDYKESRGDKGIVGGDKDISGKETKK